MFLCDNILYTLPYLHTVAAPLPVLNSMTPMGEIFPNHREWSVEFNKQVLLAAPCLLTILYMYIARHVADAYKALPQWPIL